MHGTILRPAVDTRWTAAEDAVMREVWQDYRRAIARLPHRSPCAIRSRATNLRLTKNDAERPLTAREEKRLKALLECFSSVETVAAILGRNVGTIKSFMRRRGMGSKKAPPVDTGHALFDAIRRRAYDMKIAMVDLDRSLGYRSRVFGASHPDRATIGMIAKAVEALGGRLVVEWDYLDGDDDGK